MRNWNPEVLMAYGVAKYNSHPTYEELKLMIKMKKQKIYYYSHPTYEELKQGLTSNFGLPGTIHILPMRNWNSFFPWTRNGGWRIHILPMRNWNPHKTLDPKIWDIFTSYLWGIETLKKNYQKRWLNYSHPTYEELKHSALSKVEKMGAIIHILPMRNWNLWNWGQCR